MTGSPQEPVIVCTVVGNCGLVHASFEEWVKCRVCERTKASIRYERPRTYGVWSEDS